MSPPGTLTITMPELSSSESLPGAAFRNTGKPGEGSVDAKVEDCAGKPGEGSVDAEACAGKSSEDAEPGRLGAALELAPEDQT